MLRFHSHSTATAQIQNAHAERLQTITRTLCQGREILEI